MKPTRTTEDGDMEWSRSCRDWQLPVETPRRLFVSIDEQSSGAQVFECAVTSEADTARPLTGGAGHRVIILTDEELVWLHAALGAALAEQARRSAETAEGKP